jgi:hypothetical protein
MNPPKAFISYSWTNQAHEEWVIKLASNLKECGIAVSLDKWHLKEGHEANAFMEKMVSDPDIKKVLLICDKAYAEKATARRGGVGTEAQIISPEVYKQQQQHKFVAIVRERDENGEPYLPVYIKGRVWIDMSNEEAEATNFEKILRWIYDKPLHVEPPLGKMPAFLAENTNHIALGTSTRQTRAVAAIKAGQPNAMPFTTEYFDTLVGEMSRFEISGSESDFDERVVQNIEDFLPYRNEALEVFLALASFCDTQEMPVILHKFFEKLLALYEKPASDRVNTWDRDNFKFLAHELFLYAIAALIRHERFAAVKYLLDTGFYLRKDFYSGSDPLVDFSKFYQYMRSLNHRNDRLGLRRLSIRADMLKHRSVGTGFEFRDLMQADFVLFLKGFTDNTDQFGNWIPDTLVYRESSAPFEIFARARSTAYFNKIGPMLGIQSKEDLEAKLNSSKKFQPRWEFQVVSFKTLIGEKLCTTP